MNARKALLSSVVAIGMATVSTAWAQAQAPAGSTGQCKDDTYTDAAAKRGACRGHGGVKEWYAAEKSAAKPSKSASSTKTETPATTAATPPAATAPAPTAKTAPTKSASAERSMPAPGGGAGKVW